MRSPKRHPLKQHPLEGSKTPVAWIEARPPQRGGAPALIGQVLASSQKLASVRAGAALTPDEWREIVGEKIAARTRVGRLTRGTLTVYAASSTWCNELSFLTTEILTRLRARGRQVEALYVRVESFNERPTDLGSYPPRAKP